MAAQVESRLTLTVFHSPSVRQSALVVTGIFLCFAVIGWRSTTILSTADSHGYETAAWLVGAHGLTPYKDFIHSQGPFFLYWGALWHLLLLGWEWAFRFSAWLSFLLCIVLGENLLKRAEWGWLERLGLLGALFLTPPALFGGWQFLGMNEMLLGILLALWGLQKSDVKHPWLVGLGLAIALTSRPMAVPFVACLGLLTLCYSWRKGLQIILFTLVFATLFLSPVWMNGGFHNWLIQSWLFHTQKDVVMPGIWLLRLKHARALLPLFWAWILLRPGIGRPVFLCLGTATLVTLAGLLKQPVVGSYYLLPMVFLAWLPFVLTDEVHSKPLQWRFMAILPVALWSGWLTLTAALPLKREGNVPGFNVVCQRLREAVAPNSPVLIEASISWPLVRCARIVPWQAYTDTNIMLFQSLIPYDELLDKIKHEPPEAMVLYKNNGLAVIPGFLDRQKKQFEEIPLPPDANFYLLVKK